MLYIIRHGQTALNNRNALQGRSDNPLNDTGFAQAKEAAAKMRNAGIDIDRIYSSPLIRAMQTAEEFDSERQLVIDERLIEMDYGPYEGMDLEHPAPEVLAFFMDFAGTPAPDGMEQLGSVVTRLGAFLDEIKSEACEKDILISTHAIAMKGALEYLTPNSNGSYWSKYIGNCEVYAVDIEDGEYGVPYKLF